MLVKYKLYAAVAALAATFVGTLVASAYFLGIAHGVNKCERKVNAQREAAWAQTVNEIKGWHVEDQANLRQWAESNRVLSDKFNADVNQLTAEFGKLKEGLDYDPIIVTSDCRRSYNSIELRNQAIAAANGGTGEAGAGSAN